MSKVDTKPVTMTTFVDFVLKAGTPKATVVREWKHREEYSPATDFYRSLREAIAEHSESDFAPEAVKRTISAAPPAKRPKYQTMVDGYLKWLKGRHPRCFAPRSLMWESSGGLQVRVNPELDLQFENEPRMLIKLYFKSDKVTEQRADLVLQLILAAIGELRPNRSVGFLDVANGKLFSTTSVVPIIRAQLAAEAAYWQELWPHV